MQAVVDSIWDRHVGAGGEATGMDLNFVFMNNYEVPRCSGLSADDQRGGDQGFYRTGYYRAGRGRLVGLEDRQIMMQWAMEAFTNHHRWLENTMDYMNATSMFSNEFLHDLKDFN